MNSQFVYAQLSIGKTDTVIVKRLEISSKDDEFCPFYYNNKLYFTSNRPTAIAVLNWDKEFGFPTHVFAAEKKDSIKFLKPQLFSNINVSINNGPIIFDKGKVYFSALEKRVSKNLKKILYLKLYESTIVGDSLSEIKEIKLNLDDSVSVTHPAIYKDSLLFFTLINSQGSDIYFVTKSNGTWSNPKKCDYPINTEYSEGFSSIKGDSLFFSSDRKDGLGGLDIYSVNLTDSVLSASNQKKLNSKKDDFGICFVNSNSGYFSSNRKDDDDLYYFYLNEKPDFSFCKEQITNSYSYVFKEQADFESMDTTNMSYEWDFGDGYKAAGLITTHSFEGEGKYIIALNVLEKNTGELFKNELTYDLEILNEEQLYIATYDTIPLNTLIEFDAGYSNIKNFDVANYYWDFGNEKYYVGKQIKYMFNKPGNYTIKLLGVGKEINIGRPIKHCVYKNILVLENYSINTTNKLNLPKYKK